MRLAPWLMMLMLVPGLAAAADLSVTVRTSSGQPVADAVVTIPAHAAGPIRFAWPYRVAQHNMQFEPFVLIAPVGAEIAFPNLDVVRHHVYSFSAPHPFELKLYGRDETRVVRFDKPGVIALGCNIHDTMVAFILLVDTPYAAKTDASGVAVIHGAPAGAQTFKVWHPYLRAPGNTLSFTATLRAEGVTAQAVTADLRAPPDHRRMY